MAAAVDTHATREVQPTRRKRARATPRRAPEACATLISLNSNAVAPAEDVDAVSHGAKDSPTISARGDAPPPAKPKRARSATPPPAPRSRRATSTRSPFAAAGASEGWVLARIRRSLLDDTLDEGLRVATQAVADALAPALVRVWLSDQAPWIGELSRAGGQEIFPLMRLRASARSSGDIWSGAVNGATGGQDAPSSSGTFLGAAQPEAIVEIVAATRRPLVLLDAGNHPMAQSWLATCGETLPTLTALAAYPLQVRGQLLGVLVVGMSASPGAEELAALEAVADHCAVAAEHDRLLSYSRSQEALAQTVVRQAPVAVAVLTGADYVFALANPTFAQLLGAESGLRGRRLAEVVEGAERLRDGFRLDAVYTTGEPQAMIELPIHLDRGLTYWNVTSSPLPGRTTRVGGVLVAAVDVTRQVLERQRALESAEVAQERIGQMMALHATSLAVASQLGADPRELLADILRRSIILLNGRAGTVYVADWRVGELEVIVCEGLRGRYAGSRVRIGQGLAGQVARSGQGLIVDDMRLFPTSPAIYAGEAVSAVIAVPLIHHGSVVGVLDVLDDADRRTFTADDLWLLDLFAAQAAQAIENARNYVELERAYRAQRDLDRMKDDFIATASHELRTPLTGVQGFLDLLMEYPGSRDEPLAVEFLTKAAESAGELAELTERLLQTSRLDTGRVEIHHQPVHVRALVEAVLRAQADRLAVQNSRHELIADVPAHLWVSADPERLKEVLDNVIGNAIKYSPHGGSVRIGCVVEGGTKNGAPQVNTAEPRRESGHMVLEASDADRRGPAEDGALALTPLLAEEERLTLAARAVAVADQPTAQMSALPASASQRGANGALRVEQSADSSTTHSIDGYATITVTDEGMGIPTAERDRLFGRFARLDAARSSQIRGTGLGLYICRQVMEAMGGAIWLQDSAPGRGSTFALAVPLATPQSRDE